MPVFPVAL